MIGEKQKAEANSSESNNFDWLFWT